MNSKKLFTEITSKISLPESPDEINQIALLIIEHVFGLSPTATLTGTNLTLSETQSEKLDEIIRRVNTYEPIQYILEEAHFYRRKFFVDRSVLIPRPETEEIVRNVPHSLRIRGVRTLDIGTGSGCLAITLALELPGSTVYATDVSEAALKVATKNATHLNAPVNFLSHNILYEEIPFQNLDLIVSNPPYVTRKEMESMQQNVIDFEPHTALFVPDDDPLLFYKAIAETSHNALSEKGLVIVEINPNYSCEVVELLHGFNYKTVQIIQDVTEKDRIVIAQK